MKKRVCCLYRVSTKGQVEKDDIPMQKQKCHEFAEANGWEITEEFSEKGVSGFKVSAKDRDAIQDIQLDAAQGKFDILLVFMFDRLGRKEDETPFVVEWFVKNGIEVWSTVEGEQRFDTHVDKLMNYIRYWQASGESLKTSIRTKTRLGQIVQEGRFRGGSAPYGYKLVKNGRLGKKNRELYDIEVNPDEVKAIVTMFDLADRYGYGGRKISTELYHQGLINERTGEPFHYSSIQNILRNIMYVGILRSGETKSEIFPELQIITQEQFERVQKWREQRSADYEKKCAEAWQKEVTLEKGETVTVSRPERMYPMRMLGKTLLSGNVYCGHCGARIFSSTAKKSHRAECDEKIHVYKCYNRTQHKNLCDGPSTYRAEKVDGIIDELLHGIFERAKGVSTKEIIKRQVQTSAAEYADKLKKAKAEYAKASKEFSKWENLMLDSIEGMCVFTPEQIKGRMDKVRENMNSLAERIEELEEQVSDASTMSKDIQEHHRRLLKWADMYDAASMDEKRAVAAYIIKAVTLSRDYNIQVEFNITEAQYLSGMDMA